MGKHQCLHCKKIFVRPFTLQRHLETNVCSVKSTKMKPSDDETASTDSDDIFDEGSEIEDTKESGEEEEEEENDETESEDEDEEDEDSDIEVENSSPFWEKAIDHVFGTMQEKFEETVTGLMKEDPNGSVNVYEKKVYKVMRPQYNRHLRNFYQRSIRMIDILRKDPVHKKIMDTAKRLREDEDYERDESLQYAVKKRRFLLDHKLDEYLPPTINSDS